MTLTIELPAEVEEALREQARVAGVDVATYVAHVVRDDVANHVTAGPAAHRNRKGFSDRLDSWTRIHPKNASPIDDSRDAIYEGCGE